MPFSEFRLTLFQTANPVFQAGLSHFQTGSPFSEFRLTLFQPANPVFHPGLPRFQTGLPFSEFRLTLLQTGLPFFQAGLPFFQVSYIGCHAFAVVGGNHSAIIPQQIGANNHPPLSVAKMPFCYYSSAGSFSF